MDLNLLSVALYPFVFVVSSVHDQVVAVFEVVPSQLKRTCFSHNNNV